MKYLKSTLIILFGLLFFSCEENDNKIEQEQGSGSQCTSCVHYVKKVLNITTNTANAKDWGITYNIPNYNLTNTPSINDIIVIEPNLTEWATSGEFTLYGHIGFVKSVKELSNGSLQLTVKGGNQSGNDECGCSKVSTLPLTIPQKKLNLVRFYTNSNADFFCDSFDNVINPNTIFVEGGTFEMGTNSGSNKATQPIHSVKVSSFYLSKYEVTNIEFSKFLNEIGNLEIPNNSISFYYKIFRDNVKIRKINGIWTVDKGYEDYPVNAVSWYGANEYCKWKGGRLPTEAEWEYASKGGNSSKNYLYSGSNDANICSWYSKNSESKIQKTGIKKPNELGLYDMSGNVCEWVNDWYNEDYYKNSPYENPQGVKNGTQKILKGGTCVSSLTSLKAGDKGWMQPTSGRSYYGFRIAYD